LKSLSDTNLAVRTQTQLTFVSPTFLSVQRLKLSHRTIRFSRNRIRRPKQTIKEPSHPLGSDYRLDRHSVVSTVANNEKRNTGAS